PGADAHAGRVETSLMLALDPAQVDLAASAVGEIGPLEEILPALRARGVRAVSPNGVLGDPAGSSAELGRSILSGMAELCGAALDALLAS
ncbi:MAG: mycofactocin biosynthesis peptidyl-dipeptidase MftE, partial [Actinobacteria bacterium]|nr:mycofactocin biosynthesis peptidyl-dipeptidase MftE [Actinomycetota bacterium]